MAVLNTYIGLVSATTGGTVNAITATFSPAIPALTDKLLVWVVVTGANTSTTPTFAPDGLTARTIVKKGGQALSVGDIPGALAVINLEYNLANTRWELLNPSSSGITYGGSVGGGNPNEIHFTNSSGNLASHPDLTFIPDTEFNVQATVDTGVISKLNIGDDPIGIAVPGAALVTAGADTASLLLLLENSGLFSWSNSATGVESSFSITPNNTIVQYSPNGTNYNKIIVDTNGVEIQGKGNAADGNLTTTNPLIVENADSQHLFVIRADGLVTIEGTSNDAARLNFKEDSDNGTNSITLTVPSAIATDRTITLPSGAPSAGAFVRTDASGVWSYTTPGASGAFTIDGDDNMYAGIGSMASLSGGAVNLAIGKNSLGALIDGNDNTAIGHQSLDGVTDGTGNIALGIASGTGNVHGNNNIYIGYGSGSITDSLSNSIAIGNGATVTDNNQMVIAGISNVYFGGVETGSPQSIILNASGGSGTDIAGASITIAGGKGTGNATPGVVNIATSALEASGTTLQSLVNVARFDTNTAANQTRFLVYDVQTGTLQRVKVGANASGPGGVGRALYIDNS